MHTRSRRPTGARARRRTVWAPVDTTITITAANAYSTINLLQLYEAQSGLASTAGITIMRTHLRLAVTTAVTSGNNFYYGVIMGQADDLGGSPNVGAPKPGVDFFARWQIWEHLYVDDFNSFGDAGATALTKIIDLKSKRKMLALGDSYNLAVQVPASTFPMNFQVTGRVLIALP